MLKGQDFLCNFVSYFIVMLTINIVRSSWSSRMIVDGTPSPPFWIWISFRSPSSVTIVWKRNSLQQHYRIPKSSAHKMPVPQYLLLASGLVDSMPLFITWCNDGIWWQSLTLKLSTSVCFMKHLFNRFSRSISHIGYFLCLVDLHAHTRKFYLHVKGSVHRHSH